MPWRYVQYLHGVVGSQALPGRKKCQALVPSPQSPKPKSGPKLTAEPPRPGTDDPVDIVVLGHLSIWRDSVFRVYYVLPVPDAAGATNKAIFAIALKRPGLGFRAADFKEGWRVVLKQTMILMSLWQIVSHLGEDRGNTEEEEAGHNHAETGWD